MPPEDVQQCGWSEVTCQALSVPLPAGGSAVYSCSQGAGGGQPALSTHSQGKCPNLLEKAPIPKRHGAGGPPYSLEPLLIKRSRYAYGHPHGR